jgi:hypothetical protein
MIYGLNDSFAPEPTQAAYALSANLTLALPLLSAIALTAKAAPLLENVTVDTTLRTVGLRQYDPTVGAVGGMPGDGHFVATQTDLGRADVLRFVQQVLDGKAPQIGATP